MRIEPDNFNLFLAYKQGHESCGIIKYQQNHLIERDRLASAKAIQRLAKEC